MWRDALGGWAICFWNLLETSGPAQFCTKSSIDCFHGRFGTLRFMAQWIYFDQLKLQGHWCLMIMNLVSITISQKEKSWFMASLQNYRNLTALGIVLSSLPISHRSWHCLLNRSGTLPCFRYHTALRFLCFQNSKQIFCLSLRYNMQDVANCLSLRVIFILWIPGRYQNPTYPLSLSPTSVTYGFHRSI